MAQPSKQQIEAFRSARTVRIVVNQSYGRAKGVSLPFGDIAKRFLGHADLRIVTNTEDYDLMVKIEAEGRALGASYISTSYTSRKIKGSNLLLTLDAQFAVLTER